MKKLFLAVLSVTWIFTSTVGAGEKGWFGFELNIAGESFFSLTVRLVTVASITPKSPAAAQSIAAGDEIIQIEETTVPGRKAWELKPLLQKQPGESIHLKLKRPTGQIYSVTLVAAKRPG